MNCYEIRIWVTLEQETAIVELFKHKRWIYSRIDPEYACSYIYQNERNTRLSSDYITQVADNSFPSSVIGETSSHTEQVFATEQETGKFKECGGSFLSWLQHEDVTEGTAHNKRKDGNIIEKTSCSDQIVTHDQNHGFHLSKQHDVHSEKVLSNAEAKQSNEKLSNRCRETQLHIENVPFSSQEENVRVRVDCNEYQGQNHDLGDGHILKQGDSQLITSQQNSGVPPSFSVHNVEPSGESPSLKNVSDNLMNDRAASSFEKDFDAYELNSALASKPVRHVRGKHKTRETHTNANSIGSGNLTNLNSPSSENLLDVDFNCPLQKQVSKQVGPAVSKIDNDSTAVNENIVSSKANENNDQENESLCKVNLCHEFNSGIKKLRTRLNHVVSRGKLKRKLEKEIGELSKLEFQFDKLAEMEKQLDRITSNKGKKFSNKRSASRAQPRARELKTTVNEAACISTRTRMKLKHESTDVVNKSRDVITNKVNIYCDNCEGNFKYQKNYDKHLEEGKCKALTSDQRKDCANANKRVDIYCKECEHTFKYKKNYDKHLEEDKCRHVCEFCGKIFLSGETGNYKIHLKYHTKQTDHECMVCGKKYVEFRKLKEHFRKHTGEAPYMCDECGLTFSGFGSLYSHKKTKHAGVREQFYCSQCPKVFQRYSGLTFHMKYYHQSESEKPYSCSMCNKTFRTPDILKRHETTHKETKDFKCDQCSAAFKRIQGLTEHKRRHTKDFGHFCSHCGKGFYTRQSRLVHERIHTGEKPYRCGLCSYSCALNGNLKKHMKIHNKLALSQE